MKPACITNRAFLGVMFTLASACKASGPRTSAPPMAAEPETSDSSRHIADAGAATQPASSSSDAASTSSAPSKQSPERATDAAQATDSATDSASPVDAGTADASTPSAAGGEPSKPTAGQSGGSGHGGAEGHADASGAGGADQPGAAHSGTGGHAGTAPQRSPSTACWPPLDCQTVDTAVFTLEACCTAKIDCGFDLTRPPELRDAFFGPLAGPVDPDDPDSRCVPSSKIFTTGPGQDERRVAGDVGADVLITPMCESRNVAAFTLPGCCMPDNTCGISSSSVATTLLGLVGFPFPYTTIECVSAATFNAQLRASPLAGLGRLIDTSGSCDYADLDRRLPPIMRPE